MRKAYAAWEKIKDKLLLCFANFLGFKPGYLDLPADGAKEQEKNPEIALKRSQEVQHSTSHKQEKNKIA